MALGRYTINNFRIYIYVALYSVKSYCILNFVLFWYCIRLYSVKIQILCMSISTTCLFSIYIFIVIFLISSFSKMFDADLWEWVIMIIQGTGTCHILIHFIYNKHDTYADKRHVSLLPFWMVFKFVISFLLPIDMIMLSLFC